VTPPLTLSIFAQVITTGYEIMYEVQCTGGAVPGWLTFSSTSTDAPWEGISVTCDAATTSARTFGIDAIEAAWRVCLDYYWYKEETQFMHDGAQFGARQFCNRLAQPVVEYAMNNHCNSSSQFDSCVPLRAGLSESLFPCSSNYGSSVTWMDDPQANAYMFGPLLVALAVPVYGYETYQMALLKQLLTYGYSTFKADYAQADLGALGLAYSIVSGKLYLPIVAPTSSPTVAGSKKSSKPTAAPVPSPRPTRRTASPTHAPVNSTAPVASATSSISTSFWSTTNTILVMMGGTLAIIATGWLVNWHWNQTGASKAQACVGTGDKVVPSSNIKYLTRSKGTTEDAGGEEELVPLTPRAEASNSNEPLKALTELKKSAQRQSNDSHDKDGEERLKMRQIAVKPRAAPHEK
jgi:hypothetical protein